MAEYVDVSLQELKVISALNNFLGDLLPNILDAKSQVDGAYDMDKVFSDGLRIAFANSAFSSSFKKTPHNNPVPGLRVTVCPFQNYMNEFWGAGFQALLNGEIKPHMGKGAKSLPTLVYDKVVAALKQNPQKLPKLETAFHF